MVMTNWISYGHSIGHSIVLVNWVWTGKIRNEHFICGHDIQTRSDVALQFCNYWFIIVWSLISMTLFAISVNIKNFFMRLNSAVFMVFICENRKLPFFICVKHPLFQHLHKNLKWTAMRHSQTIKSAKQALSSNVFSPLFTQAWKLLPGYFLFLLSIHS